MSNKDKHDHTHHSNMNVNVNLDQTPVLYTDSVHMTVNSDGLVIDVAQRVMSSNQMRIVARIGMSREHGKRFAQQLAQLLAMTEGQAQTGHKGSITKN